jgi:hypothetical protein
MLLRNTELAEIAQNESLCRSGILSIHSLAAEILTIVPLSVLCDEPLPASDGPLTVEGEGHSADDHQEKTKDTHLVYMPRAICFYIGLATAGGS